MLTSGDDYSSGTHTTRGMVQFTFVPSDGLNPTGDPFHGLRPDTNVAEGKFG